MSTSDPLSGDEEHPLVRENLELRERLNEVTERLDEAEATLDALRTGQGGAFVVGSESDSRVFTLGAADSFYLQLAQEVANAGTWDWDHAHARLSISDGLRLILQMDLSASVALADVQKIIHPEDLPRAQRRVVEFLENRDVDFYDEFRVRRADGTTRWLACKGRLLRGLERSSDRVIGICIDITEERALQDAARDTNRRKDEFLAMLGHELRNPLSPLTTAAELLNLEAENPEQVRELARMVTRQTDQLRRLIDDLLDVSRISRGAFQLKRELLDLREVLTAAIDMSRSMIENASHKLEVEESGRPVVVDGDRVRLTQVVGNLLINAAKYTPPQGTIRLTLAEEAGRASIVVRDNGIGIPQEQLATVFGLFTQLDSSDTRSQGGLGVGLALAQTLVGLHGGTIAAESEGPGTGSRFTVQLPVASGAASAASQISAAKPLKRFRILVVDDNASAAHLLSKLLQKLDQEICAAESASAAMEALTVFQPDIIISDIAMPGVSGYDLARGIRALHLPKQPILVALTGYGQESDRQAALAAGFDRHLVKPVALAVLRDLLMSFT